MDGVVRCGLLISIADRIRCSCLGLRAEQTSYSSRGSSPTHTDRTDACGNSEFITLNLAGPSLGPALGSAPDRLAGRSV